MEGPTTGLGSQVSPDILGGIENDPMGTCSLYIFPDHRVAPWGAHAMRT